MTTDEERSLTLLKRLVAATLAAGIHPWEPFVAVRVGMHEVVIFHPRLAPLHGATMALVDELGSRGLLDVELRPGGDRLFQITQQGFVVGSPG
jgi:hypothetical protein